MLDYIVGKNSKLGSKVYQKVKVLVLSNTDMKISKERINGEISNNGDIQ